MSVGWAWLQLLFSGILYVSRTCGNEDAKRLFDDIIKSYDKVQRPIETPSQKIKIEMLLKLAAIIDVAEKDQLLVTSVWLNQKWIDPKLKWDPGNYGGTEVLYIPYDFIWVPDIVLYNNADGEFGTTIDTKAVVYYNGSVYWKSPAVFKSRCDMNVKWFPFDTQTCSMRFGSWSYDISVMELNHINQHNSTLTIRKNDSDNTVIITHGIDICNYRKSVEWDIIDIPAVYRETKYAARSKSSFADITYSITLRRKPLFYTVNVVFPCVCISFLTILVFYLPSNSGEKISLCISILVLLSVFFLLLIDIVPANSVVLPLIGKYLLFCMLMTAFSVIMTVIVLNVHFRRPATHHMPQWVRVFVMKKLPKFLLMRRPAGLESDSFRRVCTQSVTKDGVPSFRRRHATAELKANKYEPVPTVDPAQSSSRSRGRDRRSRSPQRKRFGSGKGDRSDSSRRQTPELGSSRVAHRLSSPHVNKGSEKREPPKLVVTAPAPDKRRTKSPTQLQHEEELRELYQSPQVVRAFQNVCFIADLMQKQDRDEKIDEDWKYVAMVLDRLFLWIFGITCTLGTIITLIVNPTGDSQTPIDMYELCGVNDAFSTQN